MDLDSGEDAAEGIALNWALQEILHEVHETLSLLVKERKETNHLLEELIAVSKTPR